MNAPFRLVRGLVVVLVLSVACSSGGGVTTSAAIQTAPATLYDPSRDLGTLFQDVQLAGVFPDSKTFVDARPLSAPAEIAARYAAERGRPGFNLRSFVERNFDLPAVVGADFHSDTSRTMEEHIRDLWPVLTRSPDTSAGRSSLIPLPREYVVPGGRFREVYYWDSYFTMLGLVESGRTDLIRSMLDNFAHLIRTVGHIPNGNRTYYLSRSQPPYFAAMVGLYAQATDSAQAIPYLDALEAEHAFWMDGAERLAAGAAYRRVVRLADGSLLNRYWDDRPEPRPEAYREDYMLGQRLPVGQRDAFYRNVKSTAESGWDFSTRWMRDPKDLLTLETTDLVPVDLNSLLYHAERTIAALRRLRGQPGDAEVASRYTTAAEARRRALLAAAWDSAGGFFFDVRWRSGARVTDRPTLAAAAPLYFGLATPEQGRATAARLEREFLKPGGFVTTTLVSGQQWDAPNGWPPLVWLTIQGVRRYGRGDLADTARDRWLALNRATYRSTGKMNEKYDVADLSRRAGGGEYPTQDGFGWANGVALALAAQQPPPAPPPAAPEVTHPAWAQHAVIYEVNTRQYTAAGTFAALMPHLVRLQRLGVDILWIMPVQPIGKLNRKGILGSYYSIADYTGINPEFGTAPDFRALVDSIHHLGMKVILDWVPNHSAFDNPWTTQHRDWYTLRADGSISNARDNEGRETDWTDVAELNYDNPGLRRAMIDAMRWWLDTMNVDGFRCDVAGGVPADFWVEARRALTAVRPDLFLLAEAEDPKLHRLFDMTYGWEFHHLLNEIAQGKQPTAALGQYLARQDSLYRPDDYRMYFTSNHDENSWSGTEFERMGANHRAAYVLSATIQGSMPLLYTGQEVSLHKRLRFFEKDTVDWKGPSLAGFYGAVFALKHSQPALWNGAAGGVEAELPTDGGPRVYAFTRTRDSNTVLVAVNFGDAPVRATFHGLDQRGTYTDWFGHATVVLAATGSLTIPAHGYRVLVR